MPQIPNQGTDFPDFFGLESSSTPVGGSNSNSGSTSTPHILRRTVLNSRSGSALSRLQRRSDFSDSGRASGDSVSECSSLNGELVHFLGIRSNPLSLNC